MFGLISFYILCLFNVVFSERIFPGNPYSHREYLDSEGKYLLEWIADPKKSEVIFNVTAETLGYVGLGFSKTGMMAKADIVVAGINEKGKTYLSDRYTKMEGRVPIEDIEQNWELLDSWENGTHTSAKMSRKLDTCDRQDWPLNDGMIHILWAYGEDDVLDYHFKNRGSYPAHILQPDLSPEVVSPQSSTLPKNSNQRKLLQSSGRASQASGRNSSNSASSRNSSASMKPPVETSLDVWRLSVTVNNTNSSEPWCVIQKGPELPQTNYIIGFSTSTMDEKVKKNLDRLVIYKCFRKQRQPNQQRQQQEQIRLAESLRGSRDESSQTDLFDFSGECKNATELYSYCTDIIYTWGNGGREIFLPKNVGISFGGQEEYYLMESYLIPQRNNMSTDADTEKDKKEQTSKSSEFDVDVDILLTETPRKYTSKILKVGYDYDPMTSILVPPGASNFEIYGHCPNECTTKMIPRGKPLKLFGVSFDTGQGGKSVSLHQFRNAFEIPVILENKNHDPTFQEMQILPRETPVRPGDQLTVRCKFDNTLNKPETLSKSMISKNSESKMRCLAYLWYYQEIPRVTNATNKGLSSMSMENEMLECTAKIHPSDFAIWIEENPPIEMKRNIDSPYILDKLKKLRWSEFLRLSLSELYEFGRYRASCGVSSYNQMNKIEAMLNSSSNKNRSSNPNNGGPNKSRSSSRAIGDITVYPLQIEEMPVVDTTTGMGCPIYPNSDHGSASTAEITGSSGPLFFGLPPLPPPQQVIFGFP